MYKVIYKLFHKSAYYGVSFHKSVQGELQARIFGDN